jgi:Ni2+-binding GTPase involved in maturation of urease and hydrogenase
MSKQHPECPLYNHATCKELHNPKLCAIIREDKTCFKKQQKTKKEMDEPSQEVNESTVCHPDE